MSTVLLTPPTAEPVSLVEAKLHLRVEDNADDVLIGALITATRMQAEHDTRRALVTQTWVTALDKFPSPATNNAYGNWYGPQWGINPGPITMERLDGKTGFEIYLGHSPVSAVTSIVYIDQDGVTQTLDPLAYKLDKVSEPARLVPSFGNSWPPARNEINSVTITFTCGYGIPAKVPEGIKRWMLLHIGSMYENREAVLTGRGMTISPMPFIDSLLTPYRVMEF